MNNNINNLVFYNEVNSLEFVQIIGDMDILCLKDYKKRDLFLKKHGKQLFKKLKREKPKEKINYLLKSGMKQGDYQWKKLTAY